MTTPVQNCMLVKHYFTIFGYLVIFDSVRFAEMSKLYAIRLVIYAHKSSNWTDLYLNLRPILIY